VGEKDYNLDLCMFIVLATVIFPLSIVVFVLSLTCLDKNINKELEQEILIREIIRTVQVIRKERGLMKTDKIRIHIKADKAVENAVSHDINNIKQKTNSKKLDFDFNAEKVKLAKSIEVLGNVLEIGME
jgi:valyl-tRNA synthetase